MFAHLHVRSWFSFQAGGSAPEALAERAAQLRVPAVAITDVNGVYGAVRFQRACEERGIKPLFGAEVPVRSGRLVLLAATRAGYSNLSQLLTHAHLRDRDHPCVETEELRSHADDLFCLAGARTSHLGQLLDDGEARSAEGWAGQLRDIFGSRFSIELAHHAHPGASRRVKRLYELADAVGAPVAASGDVRYADRASYRWYDLLTCIREGITVFDSDPARPKNGEAYLKSEADLRRLIPYPEAFDRTAEIAQACSVDLLPGEITTPAPQYDSDQPPAAYLRDVCQRALQRRYSMGQRSHAARQMHRELDIITDLELENFFLVVREIVQEARRRGIRCAGRGSAANSIVAYLLRITEVDPIKHNLLFERFLHGGRKGTPDIDVDFDSERRDEIIRWMEERFGQEQTAMTATVVSYRLRSALRDVAKALGWPLDTVNDLTASVPRRGAGEVVEYHDRIRRQLGDAPLVDTLIQMVAGLEGCPRHLGLHSGGMILSHQPLHQFTPVQMSANGVRMVQFDKDDVEALGLVKFDALGLRMLSTLSESVELISRHHDIDLALQDLPLDDVRTFNMIRAGKTLGVFQIESQGQMHLLAQHQPDRFQDLISEVALFRPGPLQSNMVSPFIRRRRGQAPVRYDHPDLKPILEDTYGVILFQEQVLEVAHQFAGMSLQEADDFRALMTKFRVPEEMEKMRERFVGGAVSRGVPRDTANKVFDQVSNFVGYGFCRSHAAAFAQTVYHSAYLKCHYPAAYLASVMQHRPGMYNQMTLEEEARRFGVATRPPHINRSGLRYDLEPDGSGYAIRKPLTAVRALSTDAARAVVWERLRGPFESVEDLYRRVAVRADVLENLARAGALDSIASSSRGALWEVGLLQRRLGAPGPSAQASLFNHRAVQETDIPDLPELSETERLRWDYEMHGAGRRHPMALLRRSLQELEIRPIEVCQRFGRVVPVRHGDPPQVTVAGLAMLRQRPSTANGVVFLTLEDETGFIQCVVQPETQARLGHVLTQGALIVRGELHVEGNWRGLVLEDAWILNNIFGGYEGHPSASGGRDRFVSTPSSEDIPSPDARR
jgi:error-prone DNA polymerase